MVLLKVLKVHGAGEQARVNEQSDGLLIDATTLSVTVRLSCFFESPPSAVALILLGVHSARPS
jgi:hypothetical protein